MQLCEKDISDYQNYQIINDSESRELEPSTSNPSLGFSMMLQVYIGLLLNDSHLSAAAWGKQKDD